MGTYEPTDKECEWKDEDEDDDDDNSDKKKDGDNAINGLTVRKNMDIELSTWSCTVEPH